MDNRNSFWLKTFSEKVDKLQNETPLLIIDLYKLNKNE